MIPVTTKFTLFELTADEERHGYQFTMLQLAVIQRHIALLALEKNNLRPDPSNLMAYVQEEARIAGGIQALEALLAAADVEGFNALETAQAADRQQS